MILNHIKINELRNVSQIELDLSTRFNFFIGANGSGKTSLLESVYLLATGRSFRSRETLPLIQFDKIAATVFAVSSQGETISIQKNPKATIVKWNHEYCQSSSELARQIPCLLIYQDIFSLIDAGPALRRNLLDWGLFYWDSSYHRIWLEYRRVLKQRNALLKQNKVRAEFLPWDKMLSELAFALDEVRFAYLEALAPIFIRFLEQLSALDCRVNYQRGWDNQERKKDLNTILDAQFLSDLRLQYTQSGAHQADLVFMSAENRKVKMAFSRGQQKIILIAFKFAQATLLKEPCLFLLDDLAAELDQEHLDRVFELLKTLDGQFFISALDKSLLNKFSDVEYAAFHLRAGELVEPVSMLGIS